MKRLHILMLLTVSFSGALQAQEFIPLWPEGRKPNCNGKKITGSLPIFHTANRISGWLQARVLLIAEPKLLERWLKEMKFITPIPFK